MIVFLHGFVRALTPTYTDLDVGGVGYRVLITEPHARKLSINDETHVVTYHHVREDAIQLFGFESNSMRDWFELLIGVSGIGPKGALQILGGVSVTEFAAAIADEDLDALCRLPGIGKKTAQRLIIELKEKVAKMEWEGLALSALRSVQNPKSVTHPLSQDAIAALVSLGYQEKFATEKVRQVLDNGEYEKVTDVIRAALQQLVP